MSSGEPASRLGRPTRPQDTAAGFRVNPARRRGILYFPRLGGPMGDPARPKPVITRAEWGVLLLLAAVQFTNILDFVIVMPLAPWAKIELGIDSEQFSYAVGV